MYPVDLKRWSANPINAELVRFLIEKTKDALSPISIKKLAAEFSHTLDSSESCYCVARINKARSKVYHLDNVDSETKLKLLFVLSVPVDEELIRSNIKGTFRFDDKKRIIYYESIDKKLKLEGSHDQRRKEGEISEKSAQVQDKKKKLSRRRISSSDGSDSNDHQSTSTAIQTSRSGRLLKNRNLDANLSNVNTPRQTNNKRKTINTTADSSKRSKQTTTSRTDDLDDYNPNHSFNDSNSMANDREHVVVNDREEARLDGEQVKVEVFRGALQDEVITIGDEDDDDIQEIPPPPKRVNEVPPTDDVEIKQPVVPMTQKPEKLVQVKEEVMTEEEDVKPTLSPNRAPILQILQGLHTLVVSLYHPSLETLQNELEERMKRFEGSATSIPIAQIVWTMELCFSKMTESSVQISSEGPQFISLRDFLCYLKSFILNVKIEELKSVMDKTNECMQGCQNKRVRVKKVEEILRVTLDNITI
ncbi:unnamed protein product [Caenorhabditis brenneri]